MSLLDFVEDSIISSMIVSTLILASLTPQVTKWFACLSSSSKIIVDIHFAFGILDPTIQTHLMHHHQYPDHFLFGPFLPQVIGTFSYCIDNVQTFSISYTITYSWLCMNKQKNALIYLTRRSICRLW